MAVPVAILFAVTFAVVTGAIRLRNATLNGNSYQLHLDDESISASNAALSDVRLARDEVVSIVRIGNTLVVSAKARPLAIIVSPNLDPAQREEIWSALAKWQPIERASPVQILWPWIVGAALLTAFAGPFLLPSLPLRLAALAAVAAVGLAHLVLLYQRFRKLDLFGVSGSLFRRTVWVIVFVIGFQAFQTFFVTSVLSNVRR